jgi:CBS domain-containing protein
MADSGRSGRGPQSNFWIALIIIGASLAMLVFAAASLFQVTQASTLDPEKKIAIYQSVFNQLMAVVAAWVGAIIAFYFSRENINAVADGYRDLAAGMTGEAKLRTMSASVEMIPASEFDKVSLTQGQRNGKTIATNAIGELIDIAEGRHRSRVLVLDSEGRFVAVIHRSVLYEFLANGGGTSQAQAGTADAPGGHVLEDILRAHPMVKMAAFVAKDATVADAKSAMERMGVQCQDVFITRGGSWREPVLGWLPNTMIGALSRAE